MDHKLYEQLTLILSNPTVGPHQIGTVIVGSSSDHPHLTLHLPSPIALSLFEGDRVDLRGAKVVPESGPNASGEIIHYSAVKSFSWAEIYLRDERAKEGFRCVMQLDGKRLNLLKQVDRYCRQ